MTQIPFVLVTPNLFLLCCFLHTLADVGGGAFMRIGSGAGNWCACSGSCVNAVSLASDPSTERRTAIGSTCLVTVR